MTEFDQLQFLRPFWLLGLLPVMILIWMAWQLKHQQGAWHKVIAPQFRELLLGETTVQPLSLTNRYGLVGLGAMWLIMVVALAGPSIKSVDMPAEKPRQGTVILLDLSLSMLADDIPPNRLSRLKFTINDLLTQHPEMSVGLVGYAQTAHTITPISEDNQTLLEILPSLNPVIMPAYGSNPLAGFKQANTLLEGAHIHKGHIIWMTDDLEPDQVPPLKQWIKDHEITVSILTIGTQAGGAVHIPNYGLLKDDNGQIVLPTLVMGTFKPISLLPNVTLSHFELAKDPLSALLPPEVIAPKKEESSADSSPKIGHPLDEGAWLVLLLLPFLPLLYRKGWIIAITALSPLPLVAILSIGGLAAVLNPSGAYAQELIQSHAETENPSNSQLPSLTEVFQSMNQQGYHAWEKGNYQTALDLFEDTQWRASTEYRLGHYDKSALLFAQDKSAKGHYNRGNALAKSGQFEAAKKAYESALKLPDTDLLQASINSNLELMKQLIKAQQQAQKEAPNTSSKTPPKVDNKDETTSKKTQNKPEKNQSSDQTNSKQDQSPEATPSQSPSKPENSNQNGAPLNEHEPHNESKPDATKQDITGEKSQQTHNNTAQIDSEQLSDIDQEVDKKSSRETELADSKIDPNQASTQKISQNTADKTAESLTPEALEEQQATQNWLQQIPDQPGLFLKRKFEYQFEQQPQTAPPGHKQW
ncbi:MAG: VWA domain-containing protein [Gammaproteobacteria bacterium]|nr:VWA domain-containing protein [Gammaproteobacteria bacterium]